MGDDRTAVRVRNSSSGQQRLVTEQQLFFPSAEEEVEEVQTLHTLAPHEVAVLKDQHGRFTFKKGEAFFIPPHSELVQLRWSRGRRRERRDLALERIDCRPQYMSFEFNCRTADNVELVLEGTFFWQAVDVQAMVGSTGDTTGDICSHARSQFISLISQQSLKQFMNIFNQIAAQAAASDDQFYMERGVKIHTLEVTGYRCADSSTAEILEQIIQETTNRMNRLSQQESENEVKMHRLKGQIEQEQLTGELLDIQHQHQQQDAKVAGVAEASKVAAFLEGLSDQVQDGQQKVELWKVLRKGEQLHSVAQGNARVYFTPSDCNLSIQQQA